MNNFISSKKTKLHLLQDLGWHYTGVPSRPCPVCITDNHLVWHSVHLIRFLVWVCAGNLEYHRRASKKVLYSFCPSPKSNAKAPSVISRKDAIKYTNINSPCCVCSEIPFDHVRTGGRWSVPLLGQYSFRGLMIVIATGFIPLLPRSIISTMVIWESNKWLGKNTVLSTG